MKMILSIYIFNDISVHLVTKHLSMLSLVNRCLSMFTDHVRNDVCPLDMLSEYAPPRITTSGREWEHGM